LIIMSIVSFGLYEMYWFYKNWSYIKERENLDIRPFARGWFGIFYCHSLLRHIHEDKEARSVQVPSFSPNGLATGWVVLLIIAIIVSRAPGIAASIISAFIPSFLFLVPAQNYVNSVNRRRIPGLPFDDWSFGNVVCLVFGIIIWARLLLKWVAE
jgi:amino acid permease